LERRFFFDWIKIGRIDAAAARREICYRRKNCRNCCVLESIVGVTPIVSAVNGVAVGAGLAVGILADVSICAKSALIIDGHTRLGVAAGESGRYRAAWQSRSTTSS
jgi:hypothetical protein